MFLFSVFQINSVLIIKMTPTKLANSSIIRITTDLKSNVGTAVRRTGSGVEPYFDQRKNVPHILLFSNTLRLGTYFSTSVNKDTVVESVVATKGVRK